MQQDGRRGRGEKERFSLNWVAVVWYCTVLFGTGHGAACPIVLGMVVASKEKGRGRTLSFSLKDEYWGLGPSILAEAKRVGATGSSV